MSAPICRPGGTEASASLVALAAALLITTLATGCLRLMVGAAGIAGRSRVPSHAVTELASAASQVAGALSDDGAASAMAVIRALSGATLRDVSTMPGGDGSVRAESDRGRFLVPVNPVIADPRSIERVYVERTGSDLRARHFTSDIARLVAAGAQLRESDISLAAGVDYPRIVGLITGEPVLNVNTAPASVLVALPELVAPDDEPAQTSVARMIAALLGERAHREISAGELASAIEATATAAAAVTSPDGRASADHARLIQELTACLGVRTWVWELELERDGWRGTAVIAHLPGHPAAVVLGLGVERRGVDD